MKSFNIIRYLKKWWPLIALMSFCAGVFFMRYATSNQAYTAQSIIKYNYSQAEDGKTPSGGWMFRRSSLLPSSSRPLKIWT